MPFGRRFRRFVDRPSRSARDIERDIAEEVTFHLEMRAAELEARGLSRPEAEARARLEFGDAQRARRMVAAEDRAAEGERRRTRWLADLRQDARLAVRQLRRAPGFTFVAVLTLALGIGATTAILSAVRGIVLEPFPLHQPEALVRLLSTGPRGGMGLSVADFTDITRESRSYERLASYWASTANLSASGDPERLRAARVDAGWFELLGVHPARGRTFATGEDAEGAPRLVVLSDGFWRRRFGSDEGVIGRSITLDGEPVEVAGVVPAARSWPADVDIWLTTRYAADERTDAQRGSRWIGALGRLRPGVTLEQANDELAAISRRLAERDPRHNTGVTTQALPFHDWVVGEVRRPLGILLGAVALVALVACANVAGLLLARTTARETEMTVRASLGAGRARIVRQLLTESLLLALAGGLVAFALAVAGARLFVRFAPAAIPRLDAVRVDVPMFAFTLLLATITGVLFGLAPALHASAQDLQSRLRQRTRGAAGRRSGVRLRRLLVISELALSIILLAGAGLLLRSFAALRAVDPGFRSAGLSTFSVVLPETKYGALASQRRFLREALEGMARIPGVGVAAASFGLPLSGTSFRLTFTIDGREKTAAGEEPIGQVRVASTDYFRAMGIRLVRGRAFSGADTYAAPQVVVVSEELARRFFPGEDPIGRRIETGWGREGRRLGGTIVGIVGDVRQLALASDAPPALYAPAEQWPTDEITFVVRSNVPHESLVPAVRDVVRRLDPDLPVFAVHTGDELVARSLAQPRFYLLLLAGFAVVALLLGAVGIYGVIAYMVRQRTREIGVRMALGASVSRIVHLVVGEGLVLAVVGTLFGLAGAAAFSGLLRDQLFEVPERDAVTFAGVSLLLAVVAVAACIVPAHTAARVSPQEALRGE